MNYLKGHFIYDLLPVIPLQFIDLGEHTKRFYLIKLIRIFIGIEFLDPSAIAELITYYNINVRIKRLIDTDPVAANS